MADIIPLGAVFSHEDTRSQVLDLMQRLEAGEDIGPRIDQIRQTAAAMRACAGGLRRLLNAPDATIAREPALLAMVAEFVVLVERNVAKAEELLRLAATPVQE